MIDYSTLKIIKPISDKDIALFNTFKDRFVDALNDRANLLKDDLTICYKIHKRIYNFPKMRPGINCCIDKDLWLSMVLNINRAIKETEPVIESALKATAASKPKKKTARRKRTTKTKK